MTPAQTHISFAELLSAGRLPIITVGAPTVQGATVLGMQGIGVRTPKAAAVAAITVGLAIDWHIPNGKMLSMGLLSMIVAIGFPDSTLLVGSTTRELGASPKEHFIIAPRQIAFAMACLYLPRRGAGGRSDTASLAAGPAGAPPAGCGSEPRLGGSRTRI